MNRRRSSGSSWRILLLLGAVGILMYVNLEVVPATPPLFIPTPTPTRPPESFITDAEALLSQGKMNQAIQVYRQAIQADPKNAANYVTLARIMIYNGNYKDALSNADNALLINPNNSQAKAIRGWCLGFLGEYLEAQAAIRGAIDLDLNNGAAYAYLAEVLALQSQAGQGSLGTLDKAIEASRKAQELAPNLMETHRARGIVLEITSNYKDAAREFEIAIGMNPNIADLHMALGRNYRSLQQLDKAIEEFNRANALNPPDPMPELQISRVYATVGEFAKAIQFAQQAVKDAPSDPFMYGNLGVMYYRNRLYNDSIQPLRLSVRGGTTEMGVQVKGLPLDYGRIAEYYYIFGLALARLAQCGEALEISQIVQQGVPKDDVAVYNAQEMVNICQQVAKSTGAAPKQVTNTPGKQSTATLANRATATPTPRRTGTPK